MHLGKVFGRKKWWEGKETEIVPSTYYRSTPARIDTKMHFYVINVSIDQWAQSDVMCSREHTTLTVDLRFRFYAHLSW